MTDAPRGLPLRTLAGVGARGGVRVRAGAGLPGPLGYRRCWRAAGCWCAVWVGGGRLADGLMLAALRSGRWARWAGARRGRRPSPTTPTSRGTPRSSWCSQLALYGAFAAAAARLSSRRRTRACSARLGPARARRVLAGRLLGRARYQFLKRTFEEPIRPDLAERNVGPGAVVLALLAWAAFAGLHARAAGPPTCWPELRCSPRGGGQLRGRRARGRRLAALLVLRAASARRGVGRAGGRTVMLTPWAGGAGRSRAAGRVDQGVAPAIWERGW
jgi:hypothetical protein